MTLVKAREAFHDPIFALRGILMDDGSDRFEIVCHKAASMTSANTPQVCNREQPAGMGFGSDAARIG
jgi:hypothetical protein